MMRALTAGAALVAVAILVFGGVILFQDRQSTWRQSQQAASNLVLALERDLAREVGIYDQSLQGAVETLRLPGLASASPEIRAAAVFDRSVTANYLGSMVVVDENGNVAIDSLSTTPSKVWLGDRDYFTAQRARADTGLFISRPYRSRIRGNDPSIAISRRVSAPDGSFAGIVAGSLRLAYFEQLFSRFSLGANGSVTLTRLDGRVIYHEPYRDVDVDRDVTDSPVFRHFLAGSEGEFVDHSSFDQTPRLFAWRHVGNLPLVVSVSVSVADIYAPWQRKALLLGGVLLVIWIAAVVTSLMFRRELQHRVAAEADLRQAADQLALLAATDALTGLANRRAFDAELAREWPRAIRNRTSLALLMLDVDCFKAYNDHFGHQEGDLVLQWVAASIRTCIRRPGDLAARYGGEEFVVILPETTMTGACLVAEKIRQEVGARMLPNPGGPTGHISVSIGVAACAPVPGDEEGWLLKQADQAMYEAKAGGRNRVVGAEEGRAVETEAPA